ncbi:hypothetical protein J4467_03630 [Candidatus Woesearchaeota archaeon]|nr:hypothetical protein [Candidatus Woesearchaeota archaeon]
MASYNDFQLPVYQNTNAASTLIGRDSLGELVTVRLSIPDIILAAIFARQNVLLISDSGKGKTQLVKDISHRYFGGSGEKGLSNFLKAKRDTYVAELFEFTQADVSGGRFDSRTARRLDLTKVSRLVNIVDELNRAPPITQSDCLDLAEGSGSFRGDTYELGRNGYSVFIATVNLDKNGSRDFSGTFQMDRAMLGRSHLTLDLDHPSFSPTEEDEAILDERGYDTPGIKSSQLKDLTPFILEQYQIIKEQSKNLSLERKIFRYLIGRSFGFCNKDSLNDKQGMFPDGCGSCDDQRFCQEVRAVSERTQQTLMGLPYGLGIVAELKHGSPVGFSLGDLLLESFRFTAFHGNLNSRLVNDQYHGRSQAMMDHVVSELRTILNSIYPFINQNYLEPEIVKYNQGGREIIALPTMADALNRARIPFERIRLDEVLSSKGLGNSWIQQLRKK